MDLTLKEIEYLQYCVAETAFNSCSSRRPYIVVIKKKLIAMRAELERKKMKTYQECVLDRDPSDNYEG